MASINVHIFLRLCSSKFKQTAHSVYLRDCIITHLTNAVAAFTASSHRVHLFELSPMFMGSHIQINTAVFISGCTTPDCGCMSRASGLHIHCTGFANSQTCIICQLDNKRLISHLELVENETFSSCASMIFGE